MFNELMLISFVAGGFATGSKQLEVSDGLEGSMPRIIQHDSFKDSRNSSKSVEAHQNDLDSLRIL